MFMKVFHKYYILNRKNLLKPVILGQYWQKYWLKCHILTSRYPKQQLS